jgi:hypothetical protein
MSQEFISIPVPKDRVQEVYELLAQQKAPQSTPPAEDAPSVPVEPASDLALAARAYRESPPVMKAVFGYLANNADRDVLMTELATAVGSEPKRMAGVFGAFGHRFNKRYGGATWPFHAGWDWDKNMMSYRMSSKIAELVRDLEKK